MPRIDPVKLLDCLQCLLSPSGGIKSSAEVKRLASLMTKFSKKLVSKCIYIEILKCSDTDLLCQFMAAGGWSLTHVWLTDAINSQNWPLVREILELLLLCPVDVERLRSNSAPKLVKQLTKEAHNESVCLLAGKLVEQWLRIVRGETMPNTVSTLSETDNENSQSETSSSTVKADPAPVIVLSSNSSLGVSSDKDDSIKQTKTDAKSKNDDSEGKEKIVLKLSMKDGNKVIIQKSPIKPTVEQNDVKKESDAESKQEAKVEKMEEDEKESEDENDEEQEVEIKEKERKKKSSSSRSSSSSSKSGHKSSSSSHKSSSSSSKHKSSSSSSKDKDRDKHRSSGSSSSHHKSSSSSKSSSSKSSSSSSSRDKDRKKEKEPEQSQADKDAKTLAELQPSMLTKLGKIPKKPKEDLSSKSLDDKKPLKPSTVTAPKVKPSFSIEERDPEKRAKTVKTLNSKFRSHGLEEEAPKPPSRKDLKKTPPSTTTTSSTSNAPSSPTSNSTGNSLKRASPPHHTKESKDKDPTTSPPAEKKSKSDHSSSERSNGMKKSSSKPKLHTLVETDLFSSALNMVSNSRKSAIDAKKRKRRLSSSKDEKTPASPTTPTNVTSAPLKFYQDTLSEEANNNAEKSNNKDKDSEKETDKDKEKSPEKDELGDESKSKKLRKSTSLEEPEQENKEESEEESTPPEKKPPGIGTGPDGPPGILKLYNSKGKKKSITWRTQEDLVEVRYFELDVTERVNVTRTFSDMRNADLMLEREKIMQARNLPKEDLMVEKTGWTRLVEIDGVPELPNGAQSVEKKVQGDRERTVLQALYFNRAMIPDSASEPEFEHHPVTDPKVIPIDDITGNPDGVNDFTHMSWPEPKGDPPSQNSVSGSSINNFPNFNNFPNQGFPNSQPSPWAAPPPTHGIPGAVVPPGPFIDPMNPLGAFANQFNVAPNAFMPPGMLPPNNFGPPGPGIPPIGNRNGPNWMRGNRRPGDWDRDNRSRNWDDRDRRNNMRDARPQNRNVCRQFVKFGNCKTGDRCQYYHPR